MIEGKINSYGSLSHNHAVTDCIHKEHWKNPEGKSNTQGKTVSEPDQRQKNDTGVRDFVFSGFRGLFGKSKGFFLKIWYSGSEEITADKNKESLTNAIPENVSAGILATSAVRPDREEEAVHDESSERKVGNIEGTLSGGLKREESGIRKFLKQFGDTIARHSRLNTKKAVINAEIPLPENNTDFGIGENSYLLDSYNKSGEYATLAENRRTEGNFKVRG